MPTIPYKTADGKRVPGVTTILGNLGWNKRPLMYWAQKCGQEGRSIDDKVEADIGTIAHEMVERSLRGEPFDASKYDAALVEPARQSFANYQAWAEMMRLAPVEIEPHLVSEIHRFGGTPDLVATTGTGALVIVDWKTSAAVYADHIIQISAYRVLWDETHPDRPIDGGAYLCRLPKDSGGWAVHQYGLDALAEAWDAFLACLTLHGLKKRIERIA